MISLDRRVIWFCLGLWLVAVIILSFDALNLDTGLFATLDIALFGLVLNLAVKVEGQGKDIYYLREMVERTT